MSQFRMTLEHFLCNGYQNSGGAQHSKYYTTKLRIEIEETKLQHILNEGLSFSCDTKSNAKKKKNALS